MYYTINKRTLYDRVFEEVSRVADEAYSEDGRPLYDAVVLTERDRPAVERHIDDAVDNIVSRAFDICKYAPQPIYDGSSLASVTPRLLFYVPDLDTTMEDAIQEELSSYIALYAAVAVFQSRRAVVVQQYIDRAQAALARAITMLKSRKAPSESWS